MDFLKQNCVLSKITHSLLEKCKTFDCEDSDLNDFFLNDAENYDKQLLGRSYCWRLAEQLDTIVCAFTLSNSSMDVRHLPGSRKKAVNTAIPREKHLSSYPAMLIGRMGVSRDFQRKGIGNELIMFICSRALNDTNWAACRFLTVDAYNNRNTLKFYEKTGFLYLFSSEQQEKDYIGMSNEKELKTRLMYFDLLKL